MMTVRFESGYSVTYNNANYIRWATSRGGFHRLYDKKDGDLITTVSGNCMIEWGRPCRVDKPGESRKMDDLLSEVRSLKYQVTRLRSELKPKVRKKK